MSAYFENSAMATELEKFSFYFNTKENQWWMFKLNELTVMLISLASKVVLKIFQARLQQYMN